MKHFCSPPNTSPSLSLRTARRSDRTPSHSPSRLSKRSFVTGTLVGSNPPPSCSNPALPSPSRLCCGGGISLPAPRSSFVLSLLRLTSSTTNDPRVLFFFRRLSRKGSFEHLTPHFSISPLVLRGPDSNRPRGPARRVLPSTTRFLHESADSTFFFSRASSGHQSFFHKPTTRTPQSSPSTQFPSSPSISPDSAHSAPFSHHRQRHNSSSAERWL